MVRAAAIFTIVILVLRLTPVQANPFATDEQDAIVSNKATVKVAEICPSVEDANDDLDRENGREELLDIMGGSNKIQDILSRANSSEELEALLEDEVTGNTGWLISKSTPIIMTFVMLFVFFFCCWSGCPCCKCCRCCVKQRKTHMVVKAVIMLILSAIIGAMVINSLVAIPAKADLDSGLDTVVCYAAKLTNQTLNGNPESNFSGMLPLLDEFRQIDAAMEDNAPFVTDVTKVLAATEVVTRAVAGATETLKLMERVLTENQQVVSPQHHTCALCTALPPTLVKIRTELENGVGASMANVRKEVDKQLGRAERRRLQKDLRDTAKPVREVTTSIRDALKFFVGSDFEGIADLLRLVVLAGVASVVLAVFMLAGCGLTSGVCFIACEKGGSTTKNPYNRGVHRCACCTWCCGFFYTFLTFFVGGLLVLLSVPLAGICLVMDDLSGSTITDMGPALGLNTTGGDFQVQVDLLDECFAGAGTGDLFRILTTDFTNTTTNVTSKKTMRSIVLDDTVTPLNSKFDDLGDLLTGNSVTISDNADLVKFRKVLRDDPIDATIYVNKASIESQAAYELMSGDPRGLSSPPNMATDGVQLGFLTSLRCADYTPSTELTSLMPSDALSTIYGIDSYVRTLESFGPKTNIGNCVARSSCNGVGPNAQSAAACTASQAFSNLKDTLLQGTYRCDIFRSPTSPAQTCDPKDLTGSGIVWNGDCLSKRADGTFTTTVKRVDCSLTQYIAYMKAWDIRMERVFKRLDDTVQGSTEKISEEMRSLMERTIIDPIMRVVNGVNCKFLGVNWDGMVDGLCFQAVTGMAQVGRIYVVNAALTIFLMIFAYALWRRSVDNVNAWNKAQKSVGQSVDIP